MKRFDSSEQKWLSAIVLLAFVPLVFSRVSKTADSEIIFHRDRTLFRAEMKKLIPIGSDVRTAKALLSRNGCSCNILTDGNFHLNRTLEEAAKKSKVMASLECSRQKSDLLLFRRHWVVITQFRKTKVVGVVAFTRSTVSNAGF